MCTASQNTKIHSFFRVNCCQNRSYHYKFALRKRALRNSKLAASVTFSFYDFISLTDSSQNATGVVHCVVFVPDAKGESGAARAQFHCDYDGVCSDGTASLKVSGYLYLNAQNMNWPVLSVGLYRLLWCIRAEDCSSKEGLL